MNSQSKMYGGEGEQKHGWAAHLDNFLEHPVTKVVHWLFIIVILTLIIAQIRYDSDLKELAKALKIQATPPASDKEGMLYQGASLEAVPDHTGVSSKDSLAEQYRKNAETETLVEAGREPNLYFVPQSRKSASDASAANSNFIANSSAAAAGFRDRMSNEEELAKYIGQ